MPPQVIRLDRPLRCRCSCCAPPVIEVQAPPGNVVGYVNLDALGILRPWFSFQNADGETMLKIKGPLLVLGCACIADDNFEVCCHIVSNFNCLLHMNPSTFYC